MQNLLRGRAAGRAAPALSLSPLSPITPNLTPAAQREAEYAAIARELLGEESGSESEGGSGSRGGGSSEGEDEEEEGEGHGGQGAPGGGASELRRCWAGSAA